MITSKGTILLIDSKIHPAKLFKLKNLLIYQVLIFLREKSLINQNTMKAFKFNINEKYFNVAIVRGGNTPLHDIMKLKV